MSPKWKELLGLIPGYDSIATAGDCYFDETTADWIVDFFPTCLRHIEGKVAGKPFVLEPWQRAFVGCLFGWKRPDVTRRYRTALLLVPRKNGKTPVSAGISDLMTFFDGEQGAQNFIAAASTEQAAQMFRYAEGMFQQSDIMSSRGKAFSGIGQRTIRDEETKSFLKVLSADAHTKHGGTPHLVCVDELHAIPGRDLVDVLRTSMASANRRQPLTLYTTTMDFDRPSICNEIYDYAVKVRDGHVDDPSFLPVIYEAPRDADWTSEDVWRAANPNLGVSVSLDYLRTECKKAQVQPSYENTFKRLHLNMRTEQDQRWLQMSFWEQNCAEPDIRPGEDCLAALDLSSTRDTTSFVMLFPRTGSVIMRCWVPEKTAEMQAEYEGWVNGGYLIPVTGRAVNYGEVRAEINKLGKQYNIRQIGYDPFNAEHLVQQLRDEDGFETVEFRQGYASMSSPAKETERRILCGEYRFGRNPVLRWMASCAAIETDPAGNIKLTKAKSSGRIDGVVSLVMATGLAMLAPSEFGSIYETQGLVAL